MSDQHTTDPASVASAAVPPAPAAPSPISVNVNTGTPTVGTLAQLPSGVYLASPWKRLGGYTLDAALAFVTLGFGWLVWAAIVAAKGQTPGRQLLGMRVVAIRDGRPLSWASMVFLRGLVGGFVASMAYTFTLGVLAFMPLWDRNNQTVVDKVSSSLVVDDPQKVYA
jgi:uncharacterized RDD family membrane protein YckC